GQTSDIYSFPTRRSSDLSQDGFARIEFSWQWWLSLSERSHAETRRHRESLQTRESLRRISRSESDLPAQWSDAATSMSSCLCMRSEEHTSELQSRGHLVC